MIECDEENGIILSIVVRVLNVCVYIYLELFIVV